MINILKQFDFRKKTFKVGRKVKEGEFSELELKTLSDMGLLSYEKKVVKKDVPKATKEK